MNKSPVICFYKENLYLYSEDYSYIECSANEDPFLFLKEIENKYHEGMKIISTHFNAFCAQNNNKLIDNDCLIQVYVLNSYEIKNSENLLPAHPANYKLKFKPDIEEKDFCQKIQIIRSDIKKGRYYQVNLTSSFTAKHSILQDQDKLSLFDYFYKKFNSQYSAFLPGPIYDILSYSPELFLEKSGPSILTQPIKGTLRSNEINDLILSEKESSELSMIVDLLRNDLQQICVYPVVVSQHRAQMNLNYTTHTYSEIKGTTEKSLPEIIKMMSPGGSISGCPKKESLKAINELESNQRHFYTGSIGWWVGSDFKLNLAIRSFMLLPDQIKYFTGCGIVYDSKPHEEWNEFLTKAKHLDYL